MGKNWLELLVESGMTRFAAPPIAASPKLPRRSLLQALNQPGVRIIAEVKKRSPSAGVLRNPVEPAGLARAYQQGGAAAISVVTEPQYFGGASGWVAEVKHATNLPVLQKDFFSRPEHLAHGLASGADAVLLIARMLPGALLSEMVACCQELGLEPLVETHDEEDVQRALDAGATLVGVNSRDLATFTVQVEAAAALVRGLPSGVVGVLESGVKDPGQFSQLVAQGVRRFLIGEYLLRQNEPERALKELLEAQC
ncbi:MAG: indole-3-glycerol phosphate synthase TrpC [Thermoanaerobaculum sp.]